MDTRQMLLIAAKIGTVLAALASCVIFYIILQKVGKKTGNVSELAKHSIDEAVKKNGEMSSYKKKLSKLGVMYRVGDYNMNPSWYVMVRLAIGMIAALLVGLLLERVVLGFVAFPVGFFAVEFVFKRLNASDNKEIMMDLYNTYANIKIQMDSGVYIVESIEYSHKVAKNKRYKEALGELIINFADKTVPMATAVEIFKDRFDSREIDKLCVLLNNCLAYGSQAAYTKDIMGEVQSIILASTMEAEHGIESKTGLVTFGFFGIIVFIAGYAVISSFSSMEFF